jgi:hypothetical protein
VSCDFDHDLAKSNSHEKMYNSVFFDYFLYFLLKKKKITFYIIIFQVNY